MKNNDCFWLQGKKIPFLDESDTTSSKNRRNKPSLLEEVKDIHQPNILDENFKSQWGTFPIPKYINQPGQKPDKHYRDQIALLKYDDSDDYHQSILLDNAEESWGESESSTASALNASFFSGKRKYCWDKLVPLKDEASDETPSNELQKEVEPEEPWSKSDFSPGTASNAESLPCKNSIVSNQINNISKGHETENQSWASTSPEEGEEIKPPTVVIRSKRSPVGNAKREPENATHQSPETSGLAENCKQNGIACKYEESRKEKITKPSISVNTKILLTKENDDADQGKEKLQNRTRALKGSVTGASSLQSQEYDDDNSHCLQKCFKTHQIITRKSAQNIKTKLPASLVPKLFCRPNINHNIRYCSESKTNFGEYEDNSSQSNDSDCVNVNKIICNSTRKLIHKRNIEPRRTNRFRYLKPLKSHAQTLSSSYRYYGDSSSNTETPSPPFHKHGTKRRNHRHRSNFPEKNTSYSEMNHLCGRHTKKRVKALCITQVHKYKHPTHYMRRGDFLYNTAKKFPYGRKDKLERIRGLGSSVNTSRLMKNATHQKINPFTGECINSVFKTPLMEIPVPTTSNIRYALVQDNVNDSMEEAYDFDPTQGTSNDSTTASEDQQLGTDAYSNSEEQHRRRRRQIIRYINARNSSKRRHGSGNGGKRYIKFSNTNRKRKLLSPSMEMINTSPPYLQIEEEIQSKSHTLHNPSLKRINDASYTTLKIPPDMKHITAPDEFGCNVAGNGHSTHLSPVDSDESYILVTIGEGAPSVDSCSSSTSDPESVESLGGSTHLKSKTLSSHDSALLTERPANECSEFRNSLFSENVANRDVLNYDEKYKISPSENEFFRNCMVKKETSIKKKSKTNKYIPLKAVATQAVIFPDQQTVFTQTDCGIIAGTNRQKGYSVATNLLPPEKLSNKEKKPSKVLFHPEKGCPTTKRKGLTVVRGKRHTLREKKSPAENRFGPIVTQLVAPKSQKLCYTSNDTPSNKELCNSKSRKNKGQKKTTSKDLLRKSPRFNRPSNTAHNNETQTADTKTNTFTTEASNNAHAPLITSLPQRSLDDNNKVNPWYSSSQTELMNLSLPGTSLPTLPPAVERKSASSGEMVHNNIYADEGPNRIRLDTESSSSSSNSKRALKEHQSLTYESLMKKDFPEVSTCSLRASRGNSGSLSSSNDASSHGSQSKLHYSLPSDRKESRGRNSSSSPKRYSSHRRRDLSRNRRPQEHTNICHRDCYKNPSATCRRLWSQSPENSSRREGFQLMRDFSKSDCSRNPKCTALRQKSRTKTCTKVSDYDRINFQQIIVHLRKPPWRF